MVESLQDTKGSKTWHKIIFHRNLLSIDADERLVEVACPQPTYVVYPPGNLLLLTRHLPLARSAAVTWRVVRIVASVVWKDKKPAATQAFVIRTACVPVAIRLSCDKPPAGPLALVASWRLLGKRGGIGQGRLILSERCL